MYFSMLLLPVHGQPQCSDLQRDDVAQKGINLLFVAVPKGWISICVVEELIHRHHLKLVAEA